MYNVGDPYPGDGQSNPVLTNCDFFANSAVWGAGLANDAYEESGQFGPGSEPTLDGCIFFDNQDIGSGRGGAAAAAAARPQPRLLRRARLRRRLLRYSRREGRARAPA